MGERAEFNIRNSLLLCTQGDTKNDTWIFALAILLSSTFIYNSMGIIDQQAMDQLQYPSESLVLPFYFGWGGGVSQA